VGSAPLHHRGPAAVEPQNGYRRDASHQLADAHLVRRLRELGVPLDAVRGVVTASDDTARRELLAEQLARLERELADTTAAVASLRRLINGATDGLSVAVVDVPPCRAVVMRERVVIADVETWSVGAFEQLASRAGAAAAGSGSLFPTSFFADGVGEVTAFVVLGDGRTSRSGCEIEIVPGGRYAVVSHVGPYDDLDLAYGAVGTHVATLHRIASGPIREHYVVGPTEVDDPTQFHTDVLWPIAR
jgi:hypothetical protein